MGSSSGRVNYRWAEAYSVGLRSERAFSSRDPPDDSKQRGDRRVQNMAGDSERTRLSEVDDQGAHAKGHATREAPVSMHDAPQGRFERVANRLRGGPHLDLRYPSPANEDNHLGLSKAAFVV